MADKKEEFEVDYTTDRNNNKTIKIKATSPEKARDEVLKTVPEAYMIGNARKLPSEPKKPKKSSKPKKPNK